MSILQIKNISKNFGGLKALQNVSFDVEPGVVHSLIGPNGAGKTTLINIISGFYKADEGDILFNQNSIVNMPPYLHASKGIVRTFQNLEICKSMSVLDNVLLGFNSKMDNNFFRCALGYNSVRKSEEKFIAHAMDLMNEIGIADYADKECADVSYGVLKKLEITRVLAISPKLILLDEPVAGLNSSETKEISGIIKKIVSNGITVLLIEHDMKMVMAISDFITVLNFGELLAEGTPQEILSNKKVTEAYLGSSRHD